jgi:hypothetical protein
MGFFAEMSNWRAATAIPSATPRAIAAHSLGACGSFLQMAVRQIAVDLTTSEPPVRAEWAISRETKTEAIPYALGGGLHANRIHSFENAIADIANSLARTKGRNQITS